MKLREKKAQAAADRALAYSLTAHTTTQLQETR
jgi:hypothetical protein